MQVGYFDGIQQVIAFATQCQAANGIGWLAGSPINPKFLLQFLDRIDELVERVYPAAGSLDRVVYENFVKLSLRASFKLFASAAQDSLCEWHQAETKWQAALTAMQRRGVENSVPNFLELGAAVKRWLKIFDNCLFFLPDRQPEPPLSPSEGIVVEYFAGWYRKGRHLRFAALDYQAKLKVFELSIPTGEFNDRWPVLMSDSFLSKFQLVPSSASDVCDLCYQPTVVQVHCAQCKNKVLCYECYRRTAWGYQHNEYNRFSDWHNVFCPFCRFLLNEPSVQLAKPRLEPEQSAKRQRLDVVDPRY